MDAWSSGDQRGSTPPVRRRWWWQLEQGTQTAPCKGGLFAVRSREEAVDESLLWKNSRRVTATTISDIPHRGLSVVYFTHKPSAYVVVDPPSPPPHQALPYTRTWETGSGCCRWPYTGTWPATDTLNSWQAETSVQSHTPRRTAQTTARRSAARHTPLHVTLGRESRRMRRERGGGRDSRVTSGLNGTGAVLGSTERVLVQLHVMHGCHV